MRYAGLTVVLLVSALSVAPAWAETAAALVPKGEVAVAAHDATTAM